MESQNNEIDFVALAKTFNLETLTNSHYQSMNSFNDAGENAIHIVAKIGPPSAISVLFRLGASLDLQDSGGGDIYFYIIIKNAFKKLYQ